MIYKYECKVCRTAHRSWWRSQNTCDACFDKHFSKLVENDEYFDKLVKI